MVVISEKLQSLLSPKQVNPWAGSELADLASAGLNKVWPQKVRAAVVDSAPACVVFTESESELTAVVRVCAQNHWRILSCGNGSKLGWGNPAKNIEVVVSTARLNQVIDHWVEDFTVRVEAGVSFAALQKQLGQHRQFLALDPLYASTATLGGIIATADTGSLRQRYGSVRDMLIGVQFVRHDGEVVKAGGRVVKNVAGYDLMKLMTGAYGTLGILTQLTLRLFPQPEHSQTITVTGSTDAIRKVALQARLSGLTPVALDVLAGGSPLSLLPLPPSPCVLIAQFQGILAGVQEQIDRLRSLSEAAGAQIQTLDETLWPAISTAFVTNPDASILCKVGMLPTTSVDFLQLAETILPVEWIARLHNVSGIGLLRFEASEGSADLIGKLRSYCEAHQGYLTILQAPAEIKQQIDTWGYSGNTLGTMQKLKANFDPQSLFNPGRFVGAI
ncbi:MAG: FAD-binding oxidoreductase [Cyanobacteria bacterium P01_F01_bin.4]